MADQANNNDVADTMAAYENDEDFPDYANEQNKELNNIVRLQTKSHMLSIMI